MVVPSALSHTVQGVQEMQSLKAVELVPSPDLSVTVVLFFSDRWEGVRAALRSQAQASSSPFAGGTAMAGRADKGRSSPWAQAPSHAGSCQTGTVGRENPSSTKPADRPAVYRERGARLEHRCYFMKRTREHKQRD